MKDDGSPRGESLGSANPVERRWTLIAALLALGLLGGTFVWWGLKYGAYFGTVMYPGVALLGIGTAVMLAAAPWRASLALSGPARLCLLSLIGLATWSLVSALWSPTPDIAVEDAQRIVGYALTFGLGLWGCALLGRRMELSALPVVGAAGIVALVTLVALATSSDPASLLDQDGTIEFPLGYRNATVAFFLIALWPALAIAASPRVSRVVRVSSFVAATGFLQLAILGQSRGAIAGLIVATVVYVAFARKRLSALVWLALAALPALVSVLDANALYDAAKASGELKGVGDEMNAAGTTALILLLPAVVIGFVATRLEPFARLDSRTDLRAIAGIFAAALLAIVVVIGNPITWAADKADEFASGEPDLAEESNRFTFNTASNRSEVWRVAVDVAGDDPIFGEGGGGFQFRYNREREDPQQLARDAHSVELEMLSELGVVGLGLFGLSMAGGFAGAVRARRLGPSAASLSCGALAGGAYWLTHASFDWFWTYPAVTAPAFALLGAATAPALIMPERRTPSPLRRPMIAALAVFVLTLIPPFLSESLVERAFDTFRSDTEQAYADLDLARDLNRLSDMPALTEGSIALALEDEERAIEAFREAIRKRPEEYVGHFFLALIYAKEDPAEARSQLAVVEELNPLEARIDSIRKRIEKAEKRSRD